MHIWPSILAADLLNLESQLQQLINQNVFQIHLDVMDNHYVPNLSFGPDLCQQIHQAFPQLQIDVHLMVDPVTPLIQKFASAGAKRISVHPNACTHLDFTLQLIKQHHCQAGVALNPADDFSLLSWVLPQLDFILIMTVNPGFGGQTLIPDMLKKIHQIHSQHPQLNIMVDGGINLDNIQSLKEAGAQDFVIGSALFHATTFPHCILDFHNLITEH